VPAEPASDSPLPDTSAVDSVAPETVEDSSGHWPINGGTASAVAAKAPQMQSTITASEPEMDE
jgi:hypothetical protein